MILKFGTLLVLLIVAAQAEAQTFCLQNFNVYGPIYAASITNRTALMTDQLDSETPRCDVLQFQEVWNPPHIQQVIDALGKDYTISAPNKVLFMGLMSLFEGQIHDSETHLYVHNDQGGILDGVRSLSGVKKAYHIVKAKLNSLPEEIYFLNTHLHPSSAPLRLTQILDLYKWRLDHQDLKLVMSGDFNSEITSLERALLIPLIGVHDSMEEILGGTYPAKFCSYCSSNPRRWLSGDHLFDYIFFSNVSAEKSTLSPLRGEVNLKGTGRSTLSDHYGVRVYLNLSAESTDVDYVALENRRLRLLSVLTQAKALLKKQNNILYDGSLDDLQSIYESIDQRIGSHWNYFTQYR